MFGVNTMKTGKNPIWKTDTNRDLLFRESNKDSLESSVYYFPVVFGGAVYISCLIYHINDLLGEPTLGLLHSIGII